TGIVWVVAGEAELGARLEHPGQLGGGVGAEQTPLQMLLLRPRVGEQDKGATDRRGGQPGQYLAGIAVMDADGFEPARLDGAEQARHAVDEGLAADEADFGMMPGLTGP